MNKLRDKANEIISVIDKVLLGKHDAVKEVMLAILANGHVLLEDIPGVGKTTLALAFSKTLGLDYKRVQCTPDVLPSDLTGYSIYNRKTEEFVYQPGAVFCNLMLADEINRASPKTQSALLEVMEERQVTVEGITRVIPNPFIVIATQNFLGSVGTQRLPDTQLDRFMISLTLGYPDFDSEIEMAKTISLNGRVKNINAIIDKEELNNIQTEVFNTYIDDEVYSYIVNLIRSTREDSRIKQGASPRATIALVNIAKANAWLNGRDYVIPKDVDEQLKYVLLHRIIESSEAKVNNIDKEKIIDEILNKGLRPRLGKK